MNSILVFIALCLIGALLIEIRSHYLFCKGVEHRIAALGLTGGAESEKHGEQRTSDNPEPKHTHRTFSFGPMKQRRA